MDVVAFDPSLSATGVWIDDENRSFVIETDSRDSRFKRLAIIHQRVVKLLTELRPEVVVVEGYAFGVQNSRSVTVQAEVGGIIRTVAQIMGARVIEIPPMQWKSAIMGKSMIRAKKGTKIERALYLGFVKSQCGISFKTCDEADAYMMAQFVKNRERVMV